MDCLRNSCFASLFGCNSSIGTGVDIQGPEPFGLKEPAPVSLMRPATSSRWEITNSFRSAGAAVTGHEAVVISLVVLGIFLALSVSFIKNPRGAKGPPQWKGAAIGLGTAAALLGVYHIAPLAKKCFLAIKNKQNEGKNQVEELTEESEVEVKGGEQAAKTEGDSPLNAWNWKKKTGAVLGSAWWVAALVVSGAVMGCMIGIGAGSLSRRFRTDIAVFKRVMIATTVSGIAGNFLLSGLLMTVITCHRHCNQKIRVIPNSMADISEGEPL